MRTLFDEYITFPCGEVSEQKLIKLWKLCDNIESIERNFGLEFSCGDGKYLSDIEIDAAELEKYDGQVCVVGPPRYVKNNELLKIGKRYRFTVKIDKDEQLRYYFNTKEVKP